MYVTKGNGNVNFEIKFHLLFEVCCLMDYFSKQNLIDISILYPLSMTFLEEIKDPPSYLLVINEVILFQNIFKKEKLKKLIWRKLISSNYQLISDKVNHDYTKGIEIQSDNITFIDWDTIAKSYKNIEGIHYEQSPYDCFHLSLPFLSNF